jgi:hypothetical protein
MAPQLRVLAGPDLHHLTPITSLVNAGKAHHIKSDAFEGDVAVYIKDFGTENAVGDSYFQSSERAGVTWSIQAQGRFLQGHSGNDILFGNTFDHPLNLPWGSGAALKLMSYVDPTLEQDLGSSTKPWALSPLISTTPYLSVSKGQKASMFPPPAPLREETSHLPVKADDHTAYDTVDKRRAYFRDAERRKSVSLDKETTITIDFCYGYLSFHPTLALQLPGGVHIDLSRHWDGQQVRFVCCERRKSPPKDGEDPWGKVFWCVAFEPEEGDEGEQDQAFEQVNTVSDDID